MKKLIAFALVAVIAMSMAGCCCCLPLQQCELCGDFGADRTLDIGYGSYDVCEDCYDRYNYSFDYDDYYYYN